MHNRTPSLTQRSSRSLLELAPFVSFLDGVEECGHVLPKTPQTIGPTALHSLQVPFDGINGPLEYFLLSPEDRRSGVFSLCKRLLLFQLFHCSTYPSG